MSPRTPRSHATPARRRVKRSQQPPPEQHAEEDAEPFSATRALEDIRARLADLEALAHAADRQLEFLPPTGGAGVVAVRRLHYLVAATAKASAEVLAEAEGMVKGVRAGRAA